MNAVRCSERTRRIFVLGVVGCVMLACNTSPPDAVRETSSQTEGIPAPDASLNDASPAADFFRYGDSLRFAADTPGTVSFSRVVGGVTAVLRIRSELRLPLTDSAAYVQGRIVAKFETVGATSPYNTPVGNAYLWVRDTGGGNLRGTLVWRDYVTGATGNTAIPYYLHSSSSPRTSVLPECEDLSSAAGDTVRYCCWCFDGRRNCGMTEAMSMADLDALLSRVGRRP